jgi:membrane protein DedA with SNARE-associated domain
MSESDHQGLLNPLGVAGAAFLGSWINDQGLFYIGRYFSGSRFVSNRKQPPLFAKHVGSHPENRTHSVGP